MKYLHRIRSVIRRVVYDVIYRRHCRLLGGRWRRTWWERSRWPCRRWVTEAPECLRCAWSLQWRCSHTRRAVKSQCPIKYPDALKSWFAVWQTILLQPMFINSWPKETSSVSSMLKSFARDDIKSNLCFVTRYIEEFLEMGWWRN